MNAEIIAIGTEILLGHIVNTNTSYLSGKLASLGIDVFYHQAVGDNPERLNFVIKQALGRSDIIITTGGLGPTVDDITAKTIARALSKNLVFKEGVQDEIDAHFRARDMKTPRGNARQAYIPEGSLWLRNKMGTAPGLIVQYLDKFIIALPGPPRELMPMFENKVIPYLKKTGVAGKYVIKSRLLRTTGLAESQVHPRVKDLLSIGPAVTVGIYANIGEVGLKITAKAAREKEADAAIGKIEKDIRKRLGDYIYGVDDERLEEVVGKLLKKKRKALSIAESCTGGLLASRITDVSGSSDYFKMGCVCYSNASKISLLGVPKEKIKRYGTVSKEIALEMAKGIRHCEAASSVIASPAKRGEAISKSDIAIAITGIAGPAGGTKKKPVGLVYIAVVGDKKSLVKKFNFAGRREEVKFQASQAALDLIRRNA